MVGGRGARGARGAWGACCPTQPPWLVTVLGLLC